MIVIFKCEFDFGDSRSKKIIVNNRWAISSYVLQFRLIGVQWHGVGVVPHHHCTLIQKSSTRPDGLLRWSCFEKADLNELGSPRNRLMNDEGERTSYKQPHFCLSLWKYFISWHPDRPKGRSPLESMSAFNPVFTPVYIPLIAPKPHKKRSGLQKFKTKELLEKAKLEALVHQSLEEGSDKPLLELYELHKEQVNARYVPSIYDGGYYLPGFGFSTERINEYVTPVSVTFKPELMG